MKRIDNSLTSSLISAAISRNLPKIETMKNAKDSRYTINKEFTGLSHPMHVLRFCGEFIGAYKYKTDAQCAQSAHILARHEKLTGRKVETITGHRNPTPAEIRRGYGAVHYRDFPVSEWLDTSGTDGKFFKHWIKADDGLRYYR